MTSERPTSPRRRVVADKGHSLPSPPEHKPDMSPQEPTRPPPPPPPPPMAPTLPAAELFSTVASTSRAPTISVTPAPLVATVASTVPAAAAAIITTTPIVTNTNHSSDDDTDMPSLILASSVSASTSASTVSTGSTIHFSDGFASAGTSMTSVSRQSLPGSDDWLHLSPASVMLIDTDQEDFVLFDDDDMDVARMPAPTNLFPPL
ncbi:hypothetical protein BC940DRAFT_311205, partial [Gongronella butleri]